MEQIGATSALLYELWQQDAHVAQLPVSLRPRSEEQGYAVQALLETRSAFPLFGWKIAATSPAGQAHIGVSEPLAGRILRERVLENGGSCRLGNNLMRVAELEFAFRMGERLPVRSEPYALAEIVERIASLHPSIEIPNSRLSEFEHAGAAQLAADNACAHDFMLGPAAPDLWRDLDLADHPVVGTINDGALHHGIGRNVLGHPLTALAWLVARLARLGLALEAGQVVTTGTCLIPMPIAAGDQVRGDFGPLGQVSLAIV